MKNAITILSYCDTDRKKKMLRELIYNLKSIYPEIPILVYSHYANLECEYYSEADYYIYDRSNPKSEKLYYDWVYIPQMDMKLCKSIRDWGKAVLQMIRRSALFLNSIGIESSIYLNYDSEIEENRLELIEESKIITDDTVGLFSEWGNNDHFSLQYFWLDIKNIGIGFFESISPERYDSYDDTFTAEKVFKCIFEEEIGQRYRILSIGMNGKISGGSKEVDEDSDLRKYMSCIFPTTLKGKKILVAWGSYSEIESISAEIDGESIEIANEFHEKRYFVGSIPQHDINKICITAVNSENISKYTMILDDSYWTLNWCETDRD